MATTPNTIDFLRVQGIAYQQIKSTAPTGGVTKGDFFLTGDTWGLAFQGQATYGQPVTAIIVCEHLTAPKSTGTGNDIAVGKNVYLNITTKVVSDTKGVGDIWVGVCLIAATAADTRVNISFDGRVRG